jgi:hypothetical protein
MAFSLIYQILVYADDISLCESLKHTISKKSEAIVDDSVVLDTEVSVRSSLS